MKRKKNAEVSTRRIASGVAVECVLALNITFTQPMRDACAGLCCKQHA